MRFLNKKGISPLIATVLLIGFTVALAGVVITWGGGFVDRITAGTEERTDITLACSSDVRFEIDKVVCNDGAGVSKITIENKGSIKIEEFRLRFFNADNDVTGDAQTLGALDKFDLKLFDLAALIPAGTSRVEALPTVIVQGQKVTCADSPKEKLFTPPC
ncbi:MAG: archaellin/type IV pilin N-terminal domain-containing protein [Nanoarchaeota archaeon]